MNKITETILNRDSIAETEKIIGKDYREFSDDENMLMLAKAFHDNSQKDEYLKSLGDTHFRIKWNEFKDLIKSKGFIPALEYDFHYENRTTEEFIIYYHSDGLIITATSYWNKKDLNGGIIYGEIEANNKESCSEIFRWMGSGGIIKDSELTFEFSFDVREGLFSKLEELSKNGTFHNPWIEKKRFFWFVDYVEDDVKGYDYKAINEQKLSRCPAEMLKILGR